MAPSPVYVQEVAHYLPETVLDNAFFESIFDTNDTWIRSRIGIRERRCMSDYNGSFPVFEIGRRAVDELVRKDFELDRVDALVSVSTNGDLQYPSPANMLNEHYGLDRPAFHMQSGCSSVLYGLQVARGLLSLGEYRSVLLVTGEPFTFFADYADRRSAVFFGDAGTALVLGSEPGGLELLDVALGGKGSPVIQSTAPGLRPERAVHDVVPGAAAPDFAGGHVPGRGVFRQEGREVYEFVTGTMPGEIHDFARRVGIRLDDFEYFIGHQANLEMLRALCDKLGFAEDRHLHNLERCGNTSSAGWVTVLSEALAEERFARGDRILVSAFGAGLAWGSAALRKV